MEIKIGPAGRLNLDVPQQKWNGDGIMQACRYAGQEMHVIQKSDDEPGVFELDYLGFRASGFAGMDAAKAQASTFARTVLARMYDMVSD